MEGLLIYLAKALVEHPEDVAVSSRDEHGTQVLELTVHPDDMGQVIGRHGRIAKAIRAVVEAAARKRGSEVFVKIR